MNRRMEKRALHVEGAQMRESSQRPPVLEHVAFRQSKKSWQEMRMKLHEDAAPHDRGQVVGRRPSGLRVTSEPASNQKIADLCGAVRWNPDVDVVAGACTLVRGRPCQHRR